MIVKWKDATSYSQSDKIRKPRSFEFVGKNIKIHITSGHIYYPGEWIMHCHSVNISEKELNVKTQQQAENRAIDIVKKKLESMLLDLEF